MRASTRTRIRHIHARTHTNLRTHTNANIPSKHKPTHTHTLSLFISLCVTHTHTHTQRAHTHVPLLSHKLRADSTHPYASGSWATRAIRIILIKHKADFCLAHDGHGMFGCAKLLLEVGVYLTAITRWHAKHRWHARRLAVNHWTTRHLLVLVLCSLYWCVLVLFFNLSLSAREHRVVYYLFIVSYL